jgi:hypothetical protein
VCMYCISPFFSAFASFLDFLPSPLSTISSPHLLVVEKTKTEGDKFNNVSFFPGKKTIFCSSQMERLHKEKLVLSDLKLKNFGANSTINHYFYSLLFITNRSKNNSNFFFHLRRLDSILRPISPVSLVASGDDINSYH